MGWEAILKIKAIAGGREVDAEPEEMVDYLTYRSWAWQSNKAR